MMWMGRPIVPTLLLALATLVPAATLAQETAQTPSELEAQGVAPLDSEALRDLLVGKQIRIRSLETGEFYEAAFLASGVRVLRGKGLGDEDPQLKPRRGDGPPMSAARYAISGDRLITEFDGMSFGAQIYLLEGRYLVHRLADGDVFNYALSTRPGNRNERLTVVSLDARGIEPLGKRALRDLVVGNRLTILQRSTGDYYEVTFGDDNTRTIHNLQTGEDSTAEYGIYGDRLFTSIDGDVFFISVYRLGDAYVAARDDQGGVVDWEIVRAE
jgi:hypothetical protein